MMEANLRPSWPSYQSQMYCLHKLSEVCTQFQEETAIHYSLLHLVQPTLVTVQQGMYYYCLYGLQCLMGCACNLRKKNYALW